MVVTQFDVTPQPVLCLRCNVQFIVVKNAPKSPSEMPSVKVVCTSMLFGCGLKMHKDNQGETQPGDKVSKSTRSRHHKRDNKQLTTVQALTQLYFFLVLYGNKHIPLCPSGVVANDEQDNGFQIWHCLGTISNEIHGSSYGCLYCFKFGYPTGENVDFD
jgi:hypothetical protein